MPEIVETIYRIAISILSLIAAFWIFAGIVVWVIVEIRYDKKLRRCYKGLYEAYPSERQRLKEAPVAQGIFEKRIENRKRPILEEIGYLESNRKLFLDKVGLITLFKPN